MKLYYAPGACSLAPHIVAREAGIPLELERVDILRSPHLTERGVDLVTVNPNGYVPVLRLDDGLVLTEAAVILQYLADLKPEAGLAPPAGTPERYRVQSWLNFIATELHKSYSPWLFHAESGAKAQEIVRERIARRLAFVERHLAEGGPFLLGEGFGVADAYLFAIAGWSSLTKVDLAGFPRLRGFMDRVAVRPHVREAMQEEGLKAAA